MKEKEERKRREKPQKTPRNNVKEHLKLDRNELDRKKYALVSGGVGVGRLLSGKKNGRRREVKKRNS